MRCIVTVKDDTPSNSAFWSVVNPCSRKNHHCSSGMFYDGQPRESTKRL